MDREWGHITIKMSGHPPFGAQVILNGHEYVACRARKARMSFTKEGNCFTIVSKAADLAKIADTLSDSRTVGRLTQVCERWIYFCLWFALDPEEQQRSDWRYDYSVYQVEYSQNLLFQRGAQMDQVFQGMIDRTRARIDVPRLKTIFGAKHRPQKNRKKKARLEVVSERPTYDLTVLKLHFGKLTLKAYTKGEHVLRFEAIVHNTTELRCGRSLIKFPYIIARLSGMLQRFLNNLHCLGRCFVSDDTLNQLPLPSQVGSTRVGGIDLNKPGFRS
jgi:tRNA threonylcarbamoyladenosine modification (KEOPS) complex  Pcc1 subunit